MTIVAGIVYPDGAQRELHIPSGEEGRAALQRALDVLVLANAHYLAHHEAPPLYDAGVRYRRELSTVSGTGERVEPWLTIPHVIARGTGDCEDLAAWRAAEIGGRAVPLRTRLGWHVVVATPDGRIEDPSIRLGMR